MLNEGISDYPSTIVKSKSDSDDSRVSASDQSIQKWVNMVNRCLEQQWKDSQDLLGCAKSLMNSGHFANLDDIVKELNSLGLGMMQRSINLRQELVDNAYLTDHPFLHANNSDGDSISQLQKPTSSSCLSFSSSPDSDIYEPSSTKLLHRQSMKDDESKRRMSIISGCYSPFTLHSKLWQQKRSITPRPLMSNTTSSPKDLSICDNPHHKSSLKTDTYDSIPACTYNYYPQTSTPAPTRHLEPAIQCQQCYFCRSSMSRETTRSRNHAVTNSDNSSMISSSSSSSLDDPSPFTSAAIRHSDNSDHNLCAKRLTSSSSPLIRKLIKSPSILIPTRTSSSSNIVPPPKTTTSTPLSSLASHITPSMPSSSSSMVHTMSTKFHFNRSETTNGNRFASASSSSLAQDNAPSNRLVRSLMSRKVSFPTLFTPKKVHPMPSSSSNLDDHSVEASYFI